MSGLFIIRSSLQVSTNARKNLATSFFFLYANTYKHRLLSFVTSNALKEPALRTLTRAAVAQRLRHWTTDQGLP